MVNAKVVKIIKRIMWPVSLSILIGFVPGCGGNEHKVDVSHIDLEVEIIRFDQKQKTGEGMAWYRSLEESQPAFFELFMNRIIGDITGAGRQVSDKEKAVNYAEFLSHEDVQMLHRKANEQFADMSGFEEELEMSMKYFKYHFPEKRIPDFVSFIAPFRAAHPFTDSLVGIGLDMYLGEDFEPYYSAPMNFPYYLVRKLDKKYMMANTLQAVVSSSFDLNMKKQRLLDEMIIEGKRLYLLDALCPEMPDSLKIGYIKGQIEWNRENEYQIWEHLISSDMLYSTDKNYYVRYLNDGPFTVAKGVPQDAPPRIATWLGWQIVRNYMKKSGESLSGLMDERDADKILKISAYRP